MILNLSETLGKPPCHGKTEHGIFVKFKKPAKLLLSSLPVSPSRVLRAPSTSLYHLVPKHLRATWPRPEQSHILHEACSPNGTDNRQQHQRRTKRPWPEPSDIHMRFFTLCMTTNDAIVWKRCLNNTASLKVWLHTAIVMLVPYQQSTLHVVLTWIGISLNIR